MSRAAPTPIRSLLRGWLFSFAVFGLFSVLLSAQLLFGNGVDWRDAAGFFIRDWLPWAVLAPLLFRLVALIPFEAPRRKKAVVAYVACGVGALTLCAVWSTLVMPGDIGRDSRGGRPGREMRGRGPKENAGENRPRDNPQTGRENFPDGPREEHPRGNRPPASLMVCAWGVPIYLAILGIAHALHFNRRAKERELRALAVEASLARSRLEALRMQLQPHFLFNSLNAIAALIHRDPDKADEMIVELASFLRLTLDASGEQEIELRRELEFTRLYLRIEQVRFGDRLHVRLEVDEGTLDGLVPAFVLQPLVENAVRHGLSPHTAVTRLTLGARREGDTFRLWVADNGAGVADDRPVSEGIGLSNTRARLRELYGETASLAFRNDSGFVVEIRIPFRTPR